MPTLEVVVNELKFLTDRISTQVRAIAIGLIATTWGLLIGDIKLNITISNTQKHQLLIICAIAIVVMFCDFLQYFFGYFYTSNLRKKINEAKSKECKKDGKDILRKLRSFFFYVKQFLLVIGVIWLIKVMMGLLFFQG